MRRAGNLIGVGVIGAGLVLLGVFVFGTSYARLAETLWDLVLSVRCLFTGVPPTGIGEPSRVLQAPSFLPQDITEAGAQAKAYFRLLFDMTNFVGWLTATGSVIAKAAEIAAIAVPTAFLCVLFLKWLYRRGNTKHGKDTIPLKLHTWGRKILYDPVKKYVTGFVDFIREHRWLRYVWRVVWLFHLNLVSIAVATLAYYIRFINGFSLATLYGQLCALVTDLQVLFRKETVWAAVWIAIVWIGRYRKRTALERLRRFEARNCGFIRELPIVSILCGSMGKKKTTAITDMALSQEMMFRQKALEILQRNDIRFPRFPWIRFERELQDCFDAHTVYSLATAKAWVLGKRDRYMAEGDTDELYGYDAARYGLVYEDGLKERSLFDVLETYAQAYLIYTTESSLIVSNYAIRTEGEKADAGNFPQWYTDFFSGEVCRNERYSHILDFDVLRLGRKVDPNGRLNGSFEYGVVVISEIGKERGNNLELADKKKKDTEPNQKNDLFNAWLKLCRHSATVDNFPFVKVFTDEQRPESWGADARDLCDVVRIERTSDEKLALPFAGIGDTLSGWLYDRFMALYYDFRYRRGDNTLLVHLLKTLTAWLWRKREKARNLYGYSVLSMTQERGTLTGKAEKKRYYLLNAKIYAKRFTTDCFSDYFNALALESGAGLRDYPVYGSEKASVEELQRQHSYFIDALYRDEGGDHDIL